MSELKQVIVVNEQLGLSKGKTAAQVAHASLGAYKKAGAEKREDWDNKGAKKVILGSGDRKLEDLLTDAKYNKLPAYLVKDAGHTEVEPGSKTALAIGPAESDKIDSLTGELRLIE
ncbi:MAG: aminoacyl-tRNA hydrolase [Nanohaloarchaea archaeon]|nr:aminoacyl-tRNA hydrolase [Candidatus Nanohaloarchaea archaeon]